MNVLYVPSEVAQLTRAVRAVRAFERLQSPMNQHVPVEPVLPLCPVEDFGTPRAGQPARRHARFTLQLPLRTFLQHKQHLAQSRSVSLRPPLRARQAFCVATFPEGLLVSVSSAVTVTVGTSEERPLSRTKLGKCNFYKQHFL